MKTKLFYFICKKHGHTTEKCFHSVRFKEQFLINNKDIFFIPTNKDIGISIAKSVIIILQENNYNNFSNNDFSTNENYNFNNNNNIFLKIGIPIIEIIIMISYNKNTRTITIIFLENCIIKIKMLRLNVSPIPAYV